MQRKSILKFFCEVICFLVVLFFVSKISTIYQFRDVSIPYSPISHNNIKYYKRTLDNLGIDKDTFIQKLEQYIWNNEANLISKDILNLTDEYEEISYCVMMKSSHYSFRVNALFNRFTQKVQQITVYSYGNEVWDYSSHLCFLYLWSCINTDTVSADNLKYLNEKDFYLPSVRLINGIVYQRIPLRTTKYEKIPEFFILQVDTSNIKEEMNKEYLVNSEDE